MQHTFFVHFLPLFCTTTTKNFQKLPGYPFYGGNVLRVLVHFFFHCRSFSPWWPLEFLIFSPLLLACEQQTQFPVLASLERRPEMRLLFAGNAATKLSCCSSNKKCFLCFTGNPGSVIVPQYGSSKITVFVWGKNTILKFLGNTK